MKDRPLLPIALVLFVDVLGFAAVIPLLPFQAQRLGASPAVVGVLLATYALCGLFAAPVLGRWSDRFGRKPVLLLSQLGSLGGFVILALSPSLAWLFVARALDGITSGNVAVARAYIADVTPPKDRAAAFGVIAAAFGFGFMIGPAGAALLSEIRPDLPYWIAAGLAATSMLVTAFGLSSRPASVTAVAGATPAASGLLHEGTLRRRLVQLFAFLFAFSAFNAGFALFCERRFTWDGHALGPREVGLLLGFSGALSLMAQLLLLRRLVPRFGEARIVATGLAVGAVAYAGIAFSPTLAPLLVMLLALSIANSLLRPCLLALLSLGVPPARQGSIFGVTQSLQSAAYLVGPLMAGALVEAGWLTGWGLACAALFTVAGLAGSRGPAATQPR